jgi:hypothetical protein
MTKFNLTKIELDDLVSTMESASGVEKNFDLQPTAEQLELWDDLDDCDTNDSIEIEIEDSIGDNELYDENDGQPSEYDEWQDLYGGDDSIYEHDCDCMFDY